MKIPAKFGIAEAHRLHAIGILMNHEEHFLRFLFEGNHHDLCQPGRELRKHAQCFSHDEQLLIRAALDIWNGSGELNLSECLSTWDAEFWIRFTRAMAHFQEFRQDAILWLVKDEYETFYD
jgi:hypothetical protein